MEIIDQFIIEHKSTGISVLTFKQGHVIDCNSVYNYLNDKKYGLRRGRYSNGKLACEWNYINDKQHGVQRGWYFTGILCYEENYIHGKLHGIQRGWDFAGKLSYETKYINGTFV